MKRGLLLTAMLLMLGSACCFAEANISKPAFDMDTNTVQLGGHFGTDANTAVVLIMTKQNVETENTDSLTLSENADFAAVFNTENNGELNISINIPTSYPGGKYYVYMLSETDRLKKDFLYANLADTSVLAEVNSKTSAAELENWLKDNCGRLCVEQEIFAPVSGGASAYLFGLKPSGGFTDVPTLIKVFNVSVAQALIDSGSDVGTVLEEYRSYIGIDWSADYASLDTNVLTKFCELMKKVKLTDGNPADICKHQKILAETLTTADYKELKTVVLGYETELALDKSVYGTLTLGDKVFEKMFRNLAEIAKYEDIAASFKKYSNAQYAEEHLTNPPSGGGGSGAVAPSKVTIDKNNPNENLPQKDIPEDIRGHWAEEYIEELMDKKIVNGFEDGSFRPENRVTRAEFVKLLCAAMGISSSQESNFGDVPQDLWSYQYVSAAAANKIVYGGEDGNFKPDDDVTRQDAAVFVYRTLKAVGKTPENAASGFSDDNSIADYAFEAVGAVKGSGIIQGMEDNSFRPLGSVTRAEAAAMICRLLKYKGI